MKLYDIQGDKVVIHADLLGLPKMKELYEANPEVGYKEISYIVLKNVVDSPYDGQYEEEKARLISRQLFGTTDWRPSKDVIEAEAQFVEYYYEYLQKIYDKQIPLAKIAQRAKVKQSLKEYQVRCTQTTKAGSLMSRQAHMELALHHKLAVNLGDTALLAKGH